VENGLLLKRVASALQAATLRAMSATAIALNGEHASVNSIAENMAYSLVHGGHDCREFGIRR
jgi:hypothetical protein